jgi:TPP-dependent pyruvate/acetoin dehydrogenase alpha subunit
MAFTGDGGTSEGDFHEALTSQQFGAYQSYSFIENNGYASPLGGAVRLPRWLTEPRARNKSARY